jgi:hypothetical protein
MRECAVRIWSRSGSGQDYCAVADFRGDDFVLITRGAMANMTGAGDWRRHVTLLLEGIRGPERADNLCE